MEAMLWLSNIWHAHWKLGFHCSFTVFKAKTEIKIETLQVQCVPVCACMCMCVRGYQKTTNKRGDSNNKKIEKCETEMCLGCKLSICDLVR